MMHKKGQGAMEYLMTYGWAILVVIIVGVVLWQMGVFTPGAGAVANFSGFGPLKPVEYYCTVGAGATDTVTVVMNNGAGGTIGNITMSVAGGAAAACDDVTAAGGKNARCSAANVDCGADTAGERYEVEVSIGYDSPTGERRASAGTIWGPGE